MRTTSALLRIVLAWTIFVSVSNATAAAYVEPKSGWASFCENALHRSIQLKNLVRDVRDDALHRAWLSFVGLFPGGGDWFEAVAQARMSSNLFARFHNDRDWREPEWVAHTLSRFPKQAKAFYEMFRGKTRRAAFNRETLAWEFKYHRESRAHMRAYLKQEKPKYVAITLDDTDIKQIVARDYPHFVDQSSLRAVEIAVEPAFLFTEGKFLPRPYRRFTLVILRDDIVVHAYPILQL